MTQPLYVKILIPIFVCVIFSLFIIGWGISLMFDMDNESEISASNVPYRESDDFRRKFLDEIIAFKKSGEDYLYTDIQRLTNFRIRKVCDKLKLMTKEEYETSTGETVPAFDPQLRKHGTVLWVFFDQNPPVLIYIPKDSPASIMSKPYSGRNPNDRCSASSTILLTHEYVHIEEYSGHEYSYKLDWRL